MLIDSHAHLDYEYELSVEDLILEAKSAGIETIIAITASAESLNPVACLAEKFPNIYHSSGIHPHDAKDFTPEIFAQVKKYATRSKCVAVGELGLDFYYDHSDKATQFHALEEQISFSATCGKPIIFHSRDAESDTIHFLKIHSKEWNKSHSGFHPGVIHCFTGSKNLAEEALALGYCISFSGIITFKNAEDLRSIAKDIVPLDRLLVETDSPYLAPIPHRGKKNHPAYTRIVAEKVAELKELSLQELASHTTANTKKLFRI